MLGGEAEAIAGRIEQDFQDDWDLGAALRSAARALAGPDRVPVAADLEVAVLTRSNGRRAFRRLDDDEVAEALAGGSPETPPASVGAGAGELTPPPPAELARVADIFLNGKDSGDAGRCPGQRARQKGEPAMSVTTPDSPSAVSIVSTPPIADPAPLGSGRLRPHHLPALGEQRQLDGRRRRLDRLRPRLRRPGAVAGRGCGSSATATSSAPPPSRPTGASGSASASSSNLTAPSVKTVTLPQQRPGLDPGLLRHLQLLHAARGAPPSTPRSSVCS